MRVGDQRVDWAGFVVVVLIGGRVDEVLLFQNRVHGQVGLENLGAAVEADHPGITAEDAGQNVVVNGGPDGGNVGVAELHDLGAVAGRSVLAEEFEAAELGAGIGRNGNDTGFLDYHYGGHTGPFTGFGEADYAPFPARELHVRAGAAYNSRRDFARGFTMPQYEFFCKDCQQTFTKILTLAEYDKGGLTCPKCNGGNVEQRLQAFYAVTSKKS